MMSDEEAKFRGDTMTKFKQEQITRMGGNKAGIYGCFFGIALYFQAARWPIYTERVPFRLMIASLGYGLGLQIASMMYGNKNHQVYYT